MEQHFSRSNTGPDSVQLGAHQQQDMMANHRMEPQNQEYPQMPMGFNPNTIDMNPNQESNMAYMMPPMPMEQPQSMYGDGMGMYYQHPGFPMYDNAAGYNPNVLPYMSQPMQLLPQFDQYQPIAMSPQVPNCTQRTAYHDIAAGRAGQAHMVARGGHRKQKSFLCC